MSTSDLASKSFPQAASRGAGGEQEDIRLFFTTIASIADIGLKLDESWSPAQRRTFRRSGRRRMREACDTDINTRGRDRGMAAA